DGVLPFHLEAAAARAAESRGLYELAARISGATQDAETPEGAEETRGLHIRALLAASNIEEAARTGGRYLDEGSGVEVEMPTCRALRALRAWADFQARIDAGPAPIDLGAAAQLELWRAEAVWAQGDPVAAAEGALLFASSQTKRLPAAGDGARATLADLA